MQHHDGSEQPNEASGSNLRDSELTADSTDGEDSEESNTSGSGWLGGMSADLRGLANVAHCLTDNVKPVMSGVASLVHRTAVAVANEITQLEQDGELDHSTGDNPIVLQSSPEQGADPELHQSLMLPWEIRVDTTSSGEDIPAYVTDNDLMDAILALSDQESTFLEPFQNQGHNLHDERVKCRKSLKSFSMTFVIDAPRIDLIRRLMDIDKNLASAHSRFSGKCKVLKGSLTNALYTHGYPHKFHFVQESRR